jgi:hypothetical protein
MAGTKRGTPGEKQPGEAQLFGWGTTVDKLQAAIRGYAEKHGIADLNEAAERYVEWLAVHKDGSKIGYARGVVDVQVIVHDRWPSDE